MRDHRSPYDLQADVNTFLSELSKKLAERWLSLLVLPGLLVLAAGWLGANVGDRHAFDLNLALEIGKRQTLTLTGKPVTVGGVVVAAVLGAAAVGLLANTLSRVLEYLWLGRWHLPWRSSPATPRTWIGRRMALLDERIQAQYFGLQVALVWPRLWLVAGDSTRALIQAALDRIGAAATVGGWGILYIALGVTWWPAALIGVIAVITAWRRGRESVHGYASLVEAAIDMNQSALTTALGIPLTQGVITAQEAAQINDRLHKGTPERPT